MNLADVNLSEDLGAIVATQWQTIVAITIAAGCGLWVLWRLVRPFIARVTNACAPEPEPQGEDAGLIQIEPAGADAGAAGGVRSKARPR